AVEGFGRAHGVRLGVTGRLNHCHHVMADGRGAENSPLSWGERVRGKPSASFRKSTNIPIASRLKPPLRFVDTELGLAGAKHASADFQVAEALRSAKGAWGADAMN